ncbi:hypothetical protein ACJD0Z_18655 [Flavobacteriaceae bacterium M23B6Z8]
MALIHPTWLELKPNENLDGNQECFTDYYTRIHKTKFELGKFPKEIYQQWIHPHHSNDKTLKNYSWINYEFIEFELVFWDFESLNKLYVIEPFQPYVNLRASLKDIEDFRCIKEDLEYWKTNGTWKIAPIILDVKSVMKECPSWSELKNSFQLVEGHSRLGYLKSMKRIESEGKCKLAKKHKAYLMKQVRTNSIK